MQWILFIQINILISLIDFIPNIHLLKYEERICAYISNKNELSKQQTKCFNVDKEEDKEEEYQEKIENSTTFGKHHVCNILEDNLVCTPIKSDPESELEFYKLGLKVPNKLSKLKVFLVDSIGVKYVIIASSDNHICGIFEKQDRSQNQYKLYCWGDNSQSQLEFSDEINDYLKLITNKDLINVSLSAVGNITCISIKFVRDSLKRESIHNAKNYFNCFGGLHMKEYKSQSIVAIGIGTVCLAGKEYTDTNITRIILSCFSTADDNPILDPPGEMSLDNESVSIGFDHACTLFDGGLQLELGCWGNNDRGQTTVPQSVIFNPSSQVAANLQSCAVKQNFQVLCWGKLDSGPNTKQKHIPLHITSQVSAGGTHGCGIQDGELKCQGKNDFNQLAIPSNHQFDSKQVQTGWDFTCSLNMREKVDCWGSNKQGQSDVPERLHIAMTSVESIQSTLNRSCATQATSKSNSKILCWGGHDVQGENSVPDKYQNQFYQLAVGDYHTCLIAKLRVNFTQTNLVNDLHCFGKNHHGQNDIPNADRQIPHLVTAGDEHTCALLFNTPQNDFVARQSSPDESRVSKFRILCWGSDSKGQSSVPAFEPDVNSIQHLKAGDRHSCVVVGYSEHTQLRCWGQRQEEVDRKFDFQPLQVALGNDYDCVVDADQQVHCWGDNQFGQTAIPKWDMGIEKEKEKEVDDFQRNQSESESDKASQEETSF